MWNAARRHASVLGLTMLAAACAGNVVSDPGPGDRVQVSLASQMYAPGDTAMFPVKNVSAVRLAYPAAFCYRTLQRQEQDGSWTTISPPPGSCTLYQAYLEPGQSVPLYYILPKDLPNGVYRIALPSPTPADAQAPGPTVTSPPFTVSSVAGGS